MLYRIENLSHNETMGLLSDFARLGYIIPQFGGQTYLTFDTEEYVVKFDKSGSIVNQQFVHDYLYRDLISAKRELIYNSFISIVLCGILIQLIIIGIMLYNYLPV